MKTIKLIHDYLGVEAGTILTVTSRDADRRIEQGIAKEIIEKEEKVEIETKEEKVEFETKAVKKGRKTTKAPR